MLIEVMEEDLVIDELKSEKKEEVIKEMALKFKEVGVVENENRFIEEIWEREKIESTAIGNYIAIPHACSDTVKRLAIGFARAKGGVDFSSLDGKPVHLIFMIASPLNVKKKYVQVLARIARLCKNEKMKEALKKAENKYEILGFIKGFDIGSGRLEEVKLKDGRTVYPNHK